jgi:cation diffusion facilitator family transporter
LTENTEPDRLVPSAAGPRPGAVGEAGVAAGVGVAGGAGDGATEGGRRLRELMPSPGGSESTVTVAIAFASNLLVAIAKSFAAALTGSASMVAEAAHSWADTGNEIFLIIANKKSRRAIDPAHPLGYGREVYVWSLFAALGLFVAGSAVSITHGIHELVTPEPASDFLIGYIVLGFSALLEGTSFLQSVRQARREATVLRRDLVTHVMGTSDPTLRAVFAEDAAALLGLTIAATGLALHQITGSSVPDAIGSILVGLLLGVVAIVLIGRNRAFLVGQEVDPRVRSVAIEGILTLPGVRRVTALRLEFVGPRQVYVVADVELADTGAGMDDLAIRLRALEARISEAPVVVATTLSLSAPDEPSLHPDGGVVPV